MFWWLLASVLVAEIILYEEKLKLCRGCFFCVPISLLGIGGLLLLLIKVLVLIIKG
jgi:hypothetical protein